MIFSGRQANIGNSGNCPGHMLSFMRTREGRSFTWQSVCVGEVQNDEVRLLGPELYKVLSGVASFLARRYATVPTSDRQN